MSHAEASFYTLSETVYNRQFHLQLKHQQKPPATMAKNLTVRLATTDDVSGLMETFLSAFQDSQINARCFPPSAPESLAYHDKWIRGNIADPASHMIVAEHCDPSSPDSGRTIAGWARWVRKPVPETKPEPIVFRADMYPPIGDGALAARFFQANYDASHRVAGDVDHWFLSTLVVRRDWQRRGVGSLLMRWGLAKADEERWVAYLNGTNDGKGLYEKFGFRTVDESYFDEMSLRSYHMKRQVLGSVD
jgi:GNAT superfamily N-acetyltransferase